MKSFDWNGLALLPQRAASRDDTLAQFTGWRARRAGLRIKLIAGNHDIRAGLAPAALDLDWVGEPHDLDGLVCRHIPAEFDDSSGRPTLASHWHPVARLYGPGRDSLRLPCFLMRPRRLVLPAFGEFTGGATFDPDEDVALCATAGGRLVHLPARRRRTAQAHLSR